MSDQFPIGPCIFEWFGFGIVIRSRGIGLGTGARQYYIILHPCLENIQISISPYPHDHSCPVLSFASVCQNGEKNLLTMS